MREFGDLFFKPLLLGCNLIFEFVGNKSSAALHRATSCLRVLTVGFPLILSYSWLAVCSEVNTQQRLTAKKSKKTSAQKLTTVNS